MSVDRLAFAESSEKAAAEALFQTGRELVANGDLADACSKFEASQRLDPALGTLLHLADCYEREGLTASAWATFGEAASLAGVSGESTREQIAKTRIAALEPRLSRIAVHVSSDARIPGLELHMAGLTVPAASWGVALPIDPGTVTVTAAAPGYVDWSTTVTIQPDAPELQAVDVPRLEKHIEPAPAAPPAAPKEHEAATANPTPPPKDNRRLVQHTLGVVTGSVGIGAIAVGSVLGIGALVKNDDSLSECRPGDASRCTQKGVDLRGEAQDRALGSTIAFSMGAALLATGIIVFATTPRETPAKKAIGMFRAGASTDGAVVGIGGAL